tara:strand:- start:48 stop:758 length:711 start_codon:yes stop_codon:yes gene_type:complete
MTIPKIIHQIWLGPDKKPNIWMDSWKIDYIKQNPNWEYLFWDEKIINEKIKLKNNKIFNDEQFFTAKSDIVRYEILKKYGGIFIDSDSLWINKKNNSLNKIIDLSEKSGMFCAEEPINKWSYANGVIGFEKNHEILDNMIDFINKNYYKLKKKFPKHRQVWQVTGPQPFTEIVKNNNRKLVLPSYYFYPESFHKNNLNLDKNKFHTMYPNSIMFQYGYTTNNILKNNVMKKYIKNL